MVIKMTNTADQNNDQSKLKKKKKKKKKKGWHYFHSPSGLVKICLLLVKYLAMSHSISSDVSQISNWYTLDSVGAS